MRTVFFYGDKAVAEGVPRAFLGIPHVINEDGQPDLQINEYMLARRNGDWVGPARVGGIYAEVQGLRTLRAKPTYLRTRAYQLDAFRRWCRAEGVRPTVVNERSVDQYAEDLEEGLVTDFEGGILPQSVNQHLTAIIDFLQFATARGWREHVGLTIRTRTGRRKVESTGYTLMRRANPSEIEIWYTEDEIASFIGEFETAPGKLAAKIMYGTGLRIAEMLRLKIGDIPTLDQFRADKAKQYVNVIGKFDKRRRVPFTEQLVQEAQRFISFERRRYATKLTEPTDLLIIGQSSNGKSAPMRARALQKEFQRAREAANKSALSPHLLRHHYAAHFLLRAWKARQADGAAALRFDIGLAEPLLSHELIILKQSLGHSSLETTAKYLYAIAFLCGSSIPEAFASELSDE